MKNESENAISADFPVKDASASGDNLLISVRGLEKRFGEIEVLRGIDLDINRGDVICIIGPSGSGKSTFLRCLNLLERPDGGSIVFEGDELTDKKTDVNLHRQKMGMVFQQFNLFPHMTVMENLTCAPVLLKKCTKEEAEAKANALLARIGLADRAGAYPNQLSGGQKQRVAIARAMINQPRILLADEPTGALDSASGAQVMDLFRELNNDGVTILMITHDASVAARADRVVEIYDGRIKHEG